MKILVIGRGWVGVKIYNELLKRNHEIVFISHDSAQEYIYSDSYDWIINCAGVTGTPNVDACELNKHETIEGNVIWPIALGKFCQTNGLRLAHFSSGCIYEGNILEVDAKPNFVGSTYSLSKAVSDVYLRDIAQVYRIRMPFTGVDEQKNFLTKIIKYTTTGKLMEGGQNSLTDLDEAVVVACDLIEEGAPNGPYNLVNRGSVDMHEIVNILGLQNVNWFTKEEFKQATLAPRSNCVIPSHPKMSDVKTALQKARSTLL